MFGPIVSKDVVIFPADKEIIQKCGAVLLLLFQFCQFCYLHSIDKFVMVSVISVQYLLFLVRIHSILFQLANVHVLFSLGNLSLLTNLFINREFNRILFIYIVGTLHPSEWQLMSRVFFEYSLYNTIQIYKYVQKKCRYSKIVQRVANSTSTALSIGE